MVIFIFKRYDTLIHIFSRLSEVRPKKLYLIADQGRTDTERAEVERVRSGIDSLITWDCEIVRDYAEHNRGVYGNIALGARRVFQKEKWAIFLEDDNLPSVSFFSFCMEMLKRFENNDDVLWICGTNYLSRYKPENECSYVFTKQLMPCGWASWGRKFLASYDFELDHISSDDKRAARRTYSIRRLYFQQLFNVGYEKAYKRSRGRFFSWDYHMAWTLRTGGYVGVAPVVNLIENIGVDDYSEHGGNDLALTMTNRFCSMDSYELAFPLTHPPTIEIDKSYERLIEKMLLYPFRDYMGVIVKLLANKFFGFPLDGSLREAMKRRRNNDVK